MKRANAGSLVIFLVGLVVGAGVVGATWIATRRGETDGDEARAYATAIVHATPGTQLQGMQRIGPSLWKVRVRNRTGTEKCALMNLSRLRPFGPGGMATLPMLTPTECG
jgi:hypothetical protein